MSDDLRDPPGPKWIPTIYWNGWPHSPTIGDLYLSRKTRRIQDYVEEITTDFRSGAVRRGKTLAEFEESYALLYLLTEDDAVQVDLTSAGLQELIDMGYEFSKELTKLAKDFEAHGWPRELVEPF